MKEVDAKTKWCPLVRIFVAGDYWQSSNGKDKFLGSMDGNLRPLTKCIASGCMMWQWTSDGRDSGFCGLKNK